jgi:hypothetical protein
MLLEQPMERFRFGQIIFDTGERLPASLSSQSPSGKSVEDRPVSRDQERFSKDDIPKLNYSGQLGDRNRNSMPSVTWVWPKFVHAADH